MKLFRVLTIKYFYDIPDGQMEQRLFGDLYFRLFPGLHMGDPIPDEKTIWLFQHRLSDSGVILVMFTAFGAQLHERGMVANEGRIVDASIVPVPTQHISRKDLGTLEAGNLPDAWKENPSIARQRDTDAAWVKKNERAYGLQKKNSPRMKQFYTRKAPEGAFLVQYTAMPGSFRREHGTCRCFR